MEESDDIQRDRLQDPRNFLISAIRRFVRAPSGARHDGNIPLLADLRDQESISALATPSIGLLDKLARIRLGIASLTMTGSGFQRLAKHR
jgi:hypothetical protein